MCYDDQSCEIFIFGFVLNQAGNADICGCENVCNFCQHTGFVGDCETEITTGFNIIHRHKLCKKIYATGNGKCNFTNVSNLENKYNNEFANRVIDKFGVKETLKAFSNMGLIYKNDGEGRCYPISETATSVLDCLKLNLSKVKIRLDSTVDSISYEGASCVVSCGGKREKFDYVVCCSGSKASNLGSDKAYLYLENLGLKFNSLKGSLVPLVLKENVKSMSGVRIKCIVKLLDENNVVKYMENGEVIFKDKGISGIAIFNASSYITRNSNHKYKVSYDILFRH